MNKRLRVLIVDDEELARQLSIEYLRSQRSSVNAKPGWKP